MTHTRYRASRIEEFEALKTKEFGTPQLQKTLVDNTISLICALIQPTFIKSEFHFPLPKS